MSAPDFSATRRWWPHFLVDECMPEGRATPEAWLTPDESGVTTIPWKEDWPDHVAGTLSPGETVEFNWHEDRGRVEILLMPDGSWSLEDPRDGGTVDMFTGETAKATPAARIEDANWFAEASDWETCADSMDEFARCFADMEPPGPDGERIAVTMGFWSESEDFRVSADGKSLEKIDG